MLAPAGKMLGAAQTLISSAASEAFASAAHRFDALSVKLYPDHVRKLVAPATNNNTATPTSCDSRSASARSSIRERTAQDSRRAYDNTAQQSLGSQQQQRPARTRPTGSTPGTVEQHRDQIACHGASSLGSFTTERGSHGSIKAQGEVDRAQDSAPHAAQTSTRASPSTSEQRQQPALAVSVGFCEAALASAHAPPVTVTTWPQAPTTTPQVCESSGLCGALLSVPHPGESDQQGGSAVTTALSPGHGEQYEGSSQAPVPSCGTHDRESCAVASNSHSSSLNNNNRSHSPACAARSTAPRLETRGPRTVTPTAPTATTTTTIAAGGEGAHDDYTTTSAPTTRGPRTVTPTTPPATTTTTIAAGEGTHDGTTQHITE